MRIRITTSLVVRFFILAYAALFILGGIMLNEYLELTREPGVPVAIVSAETATPTPFLPLPVTPSSAPEIPVVEVVLEIIDGMETFGDRDPLTKKEFLGLIKELNLDPLPMEEDAYYITFLASETAYRNFAQSEGESLQSFLLRHVAWMDRQLKQGNPPVAGGLIARRIIILTDEAFESDQSVRARDYLAHGLLDSDGSWSFIDTYAPKSCAFFDSELELDAGLIHEWIHSVFHLPDHYALDYHAPSDIHGVLEGIPEPWRFYSAGGRPDISRGDFAMAGGGLRLRHYSALQLADRHARGINHDSKRAWGEMGFLAQAPQESILDFGSEVAGARILIYQSGDCPVDYPDGEASACKILGPEPVFEGYLDESGQIAIGNLFSGYSVKVPIKEGVLFIKVILGEEVRFRWMDIRDFNLAYWHGFTSSVRMRMNLISLDDDPASFDWTIRYEDVNNEPTASK